MMDFRKARFISKSLVFQRPDSFARGEVKDFEDIDGLDFFARAELWDDYVTSKRLDGEWNYRQENLSGCGPEMRLDLEGNPNGRFVSLVSNDYLGFTQHPEVITAAVEATKRYGTGAAASPGHRRSLRLSRKDRGKDCGIF